MSILRDPDMMKQFEIWYIYQGHKKLYLKAIFYNPLKSCYALLQLFNITYHLYCRRCMELTLFFLRESYSASKPVIFTKEFENGSTLKTYRTWLREKGHSLFHSSVFNQFTFFVSSKLCLWFMIFYMIVFHGILWSSKKQLQGQS